MRHSVPGRGYMFAAWSRPALASCGWISVRGRTEQDAAVVRSWQDRFGARLCTLGIDRIVLSAA